MRLSSPSRLARPMRATVLAAALLAAVSGCHSGSGNSMSADLQQTHPNLLGVWTGSAISVRNNQRSSLLLRIDLLTGRPDQFAWDLSISGSPCGSIMRGTLTAGGDRVYLQSSSYPSTSFVGSVTTPTRIVGEYSISEGPCVGDSGTIDMIRLSNAVLFEETRSWPDLDLILQVRTGR